jgi:hypothetical protein
MTSPSTVTRTAAVVVFAISVGLSACSEQGESVAPYDRVGVPAVPDRTRPVGEGSLPDGDYWAMSITSTDDGLTLTAQVGQALFDPTCTTELGADACAEGFAVVDAPTAELTIEPDDLAAVSVVASDRRNFAVDGAELLALVSGSAPDAGAPDDYAYAPYPFLLTVRNGAVVEARQIWLDTVTD